MTDKPTQKISNQIASKLSDTDWSQVRETIVMLNLATAQVEYSMTDGDDSINVLTDSFTSMSGGVNTIGKAIESFARFSDIDPVLHKEVMQQCEDLGGEMQKAIIAFQFYDKLVQRLSHVRNSMTKLTDLIGDDDKLNSNEAWKKLQEDIRSTYTMEGDKQLFDAIIAGKPINEALKQMISKKKNASEAEDDIELF
ncbi:MAG: hypothetical protein KAU21_06780 [Gammaproteobacteria bacterium]|nr:hypothetical protein [Gammaproteobacteria bacterium]